ncbi:MAG TPA: phytase [Propionibacteriaceae bacterium]
MRLPYRLGLLTSAVAVVISLVPSQALAIPTVPPRAETAALFDDDAGGSANADDPSIWVNKAHPARSLVIATAKEGGLRVYDLKARLVQTIDAPAAPTSDAAPGRFNNVDLLTGVRFPDGRADVAVVSDRGRDRLRIYRIDRHATSTPLTDVTDASAPRVFAPTEAAVDDQETAYGLATYRDPRTHQAYAVVSQRHQTSLALAQLKVRRDGSVGYDVVRRIALPSQFRLPNGATWTPCDEPGVLPQVEGMVVDPDSGTLYAGQEDVGIWRLDASLRGKPKLVDKVIEYGVPGTYDPATEECTSGVDPGFGGDHIRADVEGLTIYRDGRRGGYLLASSQGNDTFVAYTRSGNRFLTSFAINSGRGLDGSQECDGAAVTSTPLPGYPRGLLVVQDGQNTPDVVDGEGETRTNTDFKYVDWGELAQATGLQRS